MNKARFMPTPLKAKQDGLPKAMQSRLIVKVLQSKVRPVTGLPDGQGLRAALKF